MKNKAYHNQTKGVGEAVWIKGIDLLGGRLIATHAKITPVLIV